MTSIGLSRSFPLSILLPSLALGARACVGSEGKWRGTQDLLQSVFCTSFDILQEAPVGFEFLFNYPCPLSFLYLNVEWGQRLARGTSDYFPLI